MENFVPTVSCPYWMFCVICRHPKPYTHSILVKVFGSPFLDTLTTRCSHIQHKDHIKDFKSYQSGTSIFIEILKTKSILRNSWQELTWQYVLHWYSKQRSMRNRRHTPNTAWTQVQGSCGRALIQRFRHYRPSAETNDGKPSSAENLPSWVWLQ